MSHAHIPNSDDVGHVSLMDVDLGDDESPRPLRVQWFPEDVDWIASAFHAAYEAAAPALGYETRRASAVPWEDVPEKNKALMRATVREMLTRGVIAVGDASSTTDRRAHQATGAAAARHADPMARTRG